MSSLPKSIFNPAIRPSKIFHLRTFTASKEIGYLQKYMCYVMRVRTHFANGVSEDSNHESPFWTELALLEVESNLLPQLVLPPYAPAACSAHHPSLHPPLSSQRLQTWLGTSKATAPALLLLGSSVQHSSAHAPAAATQFEELFLTPVPISFKAWNRS